MKIRLVVVTCLIASAFAACTAPTQPDAGSDAGSGGGLGGGGGAGDAGTGGGGGGGGGAFAWPVPTGPITITPHESWKNRLTVPSDPFATVSAEVRWVKFTVLMRDPTKVYFQNSRTYPLHAPFAIERLDPFFGLTVSQFEARSLHEAGQEAITGAVLIGPRTNEIGIQLVRLDPYAKEMVKIVFELVKGAIDGPMGLSTFYMPTFEQVAPTRQSEPWLVANGVPVSSADRWVIGSLCYSEGWALGKLVRLGPTEIEAAYADGRLTADDVLMTDQIPAEVPPVAGIVALAPATPNSHVAILATTLKIPFVYTPHAADVEKLNALAGHQVVLTASSMFLGFCQLDVFSADALAPAVRAELLALKVPPVINFPAKQSRGAYFANTDGLRPADTSFFGGKASHYGLLRRAVPNDSYPAVALSFDVWDDAMGRQVSSGRTLRDEIAMRVMPISTWPPNLAVMKQTLASVRALIVAEASLSPAAQAGVRSALTGFDPLKGIRFRSSTNVEDTAEFTGAGLYDSATGCLADDDDGDTVGPSLCNPGRADERGVFLALRRVFASFYNDNAWLERLRHGVNETQAGMAVLVHASVPDELELANGVVTLTERTYSRDLKIVTQLGADSVTNPTGASAPEVVTGYNFGSNWYFDLVSGSSLVPLGSWVMEREADYQQLGALTARASQEYALSSPAPFNLDFEFKKQLPGNKLWLKQVRPLPVPDNTPSVVPFVLNRGAKLCVFQGERGDILGNHRSRLQLEPVLRDVRLTDAARLQSLFVGATLSQFEGDTLRTQTGAPSGWPGFVHSQQGDEVIDSFSFGSGAQARTVELILTAPRLVAPRLPPILTTRDLRLAVHSRWAQPQVTIPPYMGAPTTVLDDFVDLSSCPEDEVITPSHLLQRRTFSGNGVTVQTTFHWPPQPTGVSAGYTAPLVKWGSTEVTGLTSTPLLLTSDFAQTYRPGHHNFSEDFLFDAFRDPAVTAAQKAELMTADVKWLIVSGTPAQAEFRAVGFDGRLRMLP